MIVRKVLIGIGLVLLALVATAGVFYFLNAAPASTTAPAPAAATEAAQPTKPFVVKLHAEWCSVCLATKDEWERVETDYAERANLVVFDATDEASTARSRDEFRRLGLEAVVEQYDGATGMVLVVDQATRKVLAEVAGIQPYDNYRAPIEAALAAAPAAG